MKDRVDRCEDRVKDAVSKMDDVLNMLEDIDRKKRQRREAMDDLLRQISEFVKPGVEQSFPWFVEEDVTTSKVSNRSRHSAAKMNKSVKSVVSQVKGRSKMTSPGEGGRNVNRISKNR